MNLFVLNLYFTESGYQFRCLTVCETKITAQKTKTKPKRNSSKLRQRRDWIRSLYIYIEWNTTEFSDKVMGTKHTHTHKYKFQLRRIGHMIFISSDVNKPDSVKELNF